MIFKNHQAFTLIQLIITMTLLLILAAAVFLWIDPLARMGDSKNNKRTQDTNIIAAALYNYAKEHQGMMPVLGQISTSKKVLCDSQSGSALSCDGDSELCLTIDDSDFYSYLGKLPFDPDKTSSSDTGYYLTKNSGGNLIVGSCDTYNSQTISKNIVLKDTCSDGVYAGGYCWNLAASTNTDCDTVCSALNLDCVRNANYGPDVDTNNDYFCRLNKDLGSFCSSACNLSATGTPPIANATTCTFQKGAVICSQAAGVDNYAICPCQ